MTLSTCNLPLREILDSEPQTVREKKLFALVDELESRLKVQASAVENILEIISNHIQEMEEIVDEDREMDDFDKILKKVDRGE